MFAEYNIEGRVQVQASTCTSALDYENIISAIIIFGQFCQNSTYIIASHISAFTKHFDVLIILYEYKTFITSTET